MTIAFAIPSRVHLLDLSGPVHIFYEAAEYGADIDLRYCSMTAPQCPFPELSGPVPL